MFIKQLILEGFKTYKERTVVPVFSPHHNCILGKNGSGKSNLLDAIIFVLSDKYTSRVDDRLKLLYEGSGRDILTASVEIIFDNADARIPIESPTVSIKRVIGLKKDEFFLDNKHIARTDIYNLFESAGLSHTNPYYIVQQGRIAALIKMTDTDRLGLFKEIAGTRTYDDRRNESIRMMRETDARLETINEILTYLSQRLTELETEREELRAYQQLDNERRALEYTIYDKEFNEVNEKLTELENSRQQNTETTNTLHRQLQQLIQQRDDTQNTLKTQQLKLETYKTNKKQLISTRKTVLQKRTELSLSLSEDQDRLNINNNKRTEYEQEIILLNTEKTNLTILINQIKSEYDLALTEENNLKNELNINNDRLRYLYEKQSRSNQFRNKRERDTHLNNKIKTINTNITDLQTNISECQQRTTEYQESLLKHEENLKNKQIMIDRTLQTISSMSTQFNNNMAEQSALIEQRKNVQREELSIDVTTMTVIREKAEKSVSYSMDALQWKGISYIMTLMERRRRQEERRAAGGDEDMEVEEDAVLDGLYGPLISLIRVQPEFIRAVEVTGGASLFHVVVDTDATAQTLMGRLRAGQHGRVTFIPLNQISVSDVTYPKTTDAIPMINKISYEREYHAAVAQIFSKTLICRDMHVCSAMSTQHNLNSITLSGDRIDRKGAMTGGYIESRSSRMKLWADWTEASTNERTAIEKQSSIKSQINTFDVEMNALKTRYNHLSEQKKTLQRTVTSAENDIRVIQTEMTQLREQIATQESRIADLALKLTQHTLEVTTYQQEVASPFTATGLSDDEQAELNTLVARIEEIKVNLIAATAVRNDHLNRLNTNKTHLEMNIDKRLTELTEFITNARAGSTETDVNRTRHEYETYTANLNDLNQTIADIDSAIDEAENEVKRLTSLYDDLRQQVDQLQGQITESFRNIENVVSKRTQYLRQKDDAHRRIIELGTLPSDAFHKYQQKTFKYCLKHLEEINNALKHYKHVNKKAFDQYNAFTTQKIELTERKDDLDKGRRSILDLIEHLDNKKDEAIDRTFKTIAKHFSDVFSQLVPGGKGILVIQTKAEGEDDLDNSADPDGMTQAQRSRAARDRIGSGVGSGRRVYTGIGIKVSFGGTDTVNYQLSGGQESVVALSLIFAIQRCDPSPFYLFDEIDSALDAVHRAAVAKMIEERSQDTQFITTTFNSELVSVSDRFYGVVFENKVSRVKLITKEEAYQLIQAEAADTQEEEESQ